MSNFSGNVFDKVIDEQRQGELFGKNNTQNLMHLPAKGRKMYLESYGCAMNFSDSEIVASIMAKEGYTATNVLPEADVVFINTCSIRENAEDRVRARLREFRTVKRNHKPDMIIGVLGCMAERIKEKLLEEEQLVDLVIGPDAYKDLPNLLLKIDGGDPSAVNVLLSRDETYADIAPVRLGGNGILAFVTIMRGCDNMCSFCVVPFTRGRERSRDTLSIIDEIKDLQLRGYKEIMLLGQNVDSYHWQATQWNETVNFAKLLQLAAEAAPNMRIRFSTSHPKDISDEVLHTIAAHHNICKHIHLPVQSGSTTTLHRMNRTYTRAWYLDRISKIKEIIPNCGISTDIITGFCDETDQEHHETITLMQEVQFDFAYHFKYSERPGTLAARRYTDNTPEPTKNQRLQHIIQLQQQHSLQNNQNDIGKTYEILIEGNSKRSENDFCGRTTHNKMVIFEKIEGLQKGDYCHVTITSCTQATLKGTVIVQ
jgi:tRNA-2-methylthio-N6-dimethylallyladenosine synthase